MLIFLTSVCSITRLCANMRALVPTGRGRA